MIFFFNDTATTEIYTLSLHDALPIYGPQGGAGPRAAGRRRRLRGAAERAARQPGEPAGAAARRQADRKSTRLNSSHANISYAVFCLKKKKNNVTQILTVPWYYHILSL